MDVGEVLEHARRVTGRSFASRDLAVLERHGFWVVRLASDVMAYVARDAQASTALARQRRILARVAPRVSFAVPKPIGPIEVDGLIDLRESVAGATGPRQHARMMADPTLLRNASVWMGATLAELHAALTVSELAAFATPEPEWPPSLERLRAGIDAHVEGAARNDALAVAEMWHDGRAHANANADVFVHADFGSHNFAFDESSGMPTGVFDFHDAGRRSRAFDFKLLPSYGEKALELAAQEYRLRSGTAISVGDVRLAHAATALSYLAWRAEDPVAHDRDSGRDRDGAIGWATDAVCAAIH